MESQKITVTLPRQLLKQLDNVALHDFASRSDVIRIALLDYLSQPTRQVIADPEAVAVDKMYERIKKDYPFINPHDKGLVRFYYEMKIKGFTEESEATE